MRRGGDCESEGGGGAAALLARGSVKAMVLGRLGRGEFGSDGGTCKGENVDASDGGGVLGIVLSIPNVIRVLCSPISRYSTT